METTIKYDRVVLVKELNDKFCKVGEYFEVCNVLEDSFVLRDAKSKIAVGVVSFNDFERCFVHEKDFTGWTKWTMMTGFDGQRDIYYRSNGRKIQVKFLTDNIRAEASCHKDDDFNLYYGLNLAYLRCRNKAFAKKKDEYTNILKKIDIEMIDNNRSIENMLSSLNK